LAEILNNKKMKNKNMPLELKPGLRIGVGKGKLVLSHKEVKDDGLEIWAINYHLHIDGPIRDVFYASSQILREIAKVEELERENKTRYEYGRRYFHRCNELHEQLAKSENLRDVANRANKERIDELENLNTSLDLQIKEQYKVLLEKIEKDEKDIQQFGKEYKHLHNLIDSEKQLTNSLSSKLDYSRAWNFGLWATTLCFFALWLIALYF
jgi:hypothetical protein